MTPRLPFARSSALTLAREQDQIARTPGLQQVTTPAGDRAWLVCDYSAVRRLFAHPALGRSHPDPIHAPIISRAALAGAPIGDDLEEEQAGHQRMRALLAPAFAPRRMRSLAARTAELVERLLTDMRTAGAPGDLHRDLAFPLPMQVICGLLGLPTADAASLHGWSVRLADLTNGDRAAEAWEELVRYMRVVVTDRVRYPREDVISDLVRSEVGADANEIAGMCAGVLFAGHETTVARIDLGTLLLLEHPAQRAALQQEPELLESAVEEILRLAAPTGSGGQTRYAHADIEVDGKVIRRGEAVLLAEISANRDPKVFTNPEHFDVRRSPNPHMTFGFGPRFCIGASLARIELRATFAALFTRFPTLRLAVPAERIRAREDLFTGGLDSLPITW